MAVGALAPRPTEASLPSIKAESEMQLPGATRILTERVLDRLMRRVTEDGMARREKHLLINSHPPASQFI